MQKHPRVIGNREISYTMSLPKPEYAVFPLLCPIREYEWIPNWQCEIKHSLSGVAEEGCVFTTNQADYGFGSWFCTRYDPPLAVDYLTFFEKGFFRRLQIRLQKNMTGCSACWTWFLVPVTPQGKEVVDAIDDSDYQELMRYIEYALSHYLEKRTMPEPPDSKQVHIPE